MQVTETLKDGLKREIKIVIPAEELAAKLTERLDSARTKVNLNGFRPGKVPPAHLRKIYGKSFMAEVINEILAETPRSVLAERGERAAAQPKVEMSEDEAEAEKVLGGAADFIFSLNYEILPKIEIKDVAAIEIIREIVDVPEKEIEEQLERVASSTRNYVEKKGKAEKGDRVTLDYLGKIDNVAFDGGADTDAQLVLGSNMFIPGFEEQLIGVAAGDKKEIAVTFPENYQAAHLAGKKAVFDITVKIVAAPETVAINDETAKKLGLESLNKLKEAIRGQIESRYGALTRQKVKRQILDSLDKTYQFEAPQQLIEIEFNTIWAQISQELKQAGRSFEDEDMTEEEAREEYRRLAERRVRLGLVLSEIGETAGLTVTEDELQKAVYAQLQQFPGQEKQVMEYFRRSPEAVANLRAPIFEEKVIDHLLGKIKVSDKKVTVAELTAEEEEETAAAKKKAKSAAAKKISAVKSGDTAGVENRAKADPAGEETAAKAEED